VLDAQRSFSIPRLLGPAIDWLTTDEEGFVLTGGDGAYKRAQRTWAAGEASPRR
jgi:hypothetical protein